MLLHSKAIDRGVASCITVILAIRLAGLQMNEANRSALLKIMTYKTFQRISLFLLRFEMKLKIEVDSDDRDQSSAAKYHTPRILSQSSSRSQK
jgi:hypothetical protein